MAGRILLLCTIAGLSAALTGCGQKAMVSQLPEPNFNGPMVTAPPRPVAPAGPKFVEAKPEPEKPRPVARATGRMTGPRDWTPSAPARSWKWIVIHHSATPGGNAAQFNKMHKDKGWDELGYHFVIGNGTDSADGLVEVGPRWPRQKWGAHAKTADNRYNDYGIGVCLVGNFDVDRPTARQEQELARLVAFLMKTYRIPPSRIVGHDDTKATACPGKHMSIAHVRRMATQALADAGEGVEPEALAAGTQLMEEPQE